MEGAQTGFDLDRFIAEKQSRGESKREKSLVREPEQKEKQEAKKKQSTAQRFHSDPGAKTRFNNLMMSSKKVIGNWGLGAKKKSSLEDGVSKIDNNTASQLLIAHRRLRESHILPAEYFSFAQNGDAIEILNDIRATPTSSVSAELSYVVKKFGCIEEFQSLLDCVMNKNRHELCLVENKDFVHCVQRPAQELMLISGML